MKINLTLKRLILGLLSLVMALSWHSLAVNPAFAQALPRRVETAVLRTFERDYHYRLNQLRVLAAQRTTWQDCSTALPQEPLSEQPCGLQERAGWRVRVTGEFPAIQHSIQRVYYVESRGRRHRESVVTLDPVESLTETERADINTQLNQPLAELQILAAQETAVYSSMNCQRFCDDPPLSLAWQVLVRQNGINRLVSLNTLVPSAEDTTPREFFSAADRLQLGRLPIALANRVMQDAQDRLPPGEESRVRLRSARAITWNLCHGVDGPTREVRGICPDVDVSGWEMLVDVGTQQQPLSLAYYIPQESDPQSYIPWPDGLKSISDALSAQILQTVSTQVDIPATDLRLHGVWPQFLNQCLAANESVLSCRNGIRSGWQVSVLWINGPMTLPVTLPMMGPTLFTYNINLFGTEAQFVSQGQLMPPPP
jgi:hypothetical protein